MLRVVDERADARSLGGIGGGGDEGVRECQFDAEYRSTVGM
jgi:hypothetical protein